MRAVSSMFVAMFVSLMLCTAACGSSTSATTGATTGIASTTTGGTTTGGKLLPDGTACTADTACNSGVCGIDGNGKCCSHACTAADATCGATACDAAGACSYPTALDCGQSCVGATLSQSSCDGHGKCAPEVGGSACPGNFDCAVDGGCRTSCSSIADCGTGFACNDGKCVAPIVTGTCTENDDCTSGFCGATGSGHCCAAHCDSSDTTCGATDCDGTGACTYPANGSACGTTIASCTGSTETDAQTCNGSGTCSLAKQVLCGNFLCGPTKCLTTCSDATSCATGDFCDVANTACCAGLTDGATLAVDSIFGDDAKGCCGLGANAPCGSLRHALALVAASKAQNVMLVATVDGGGGDWVPTAGEAYPIALSAGVELSAGGVFFNDQSTKNEVIDVLAGTPPASLVGSAGAPVMVGMNSDGAQTLDPSAIQIENGATLYIANALVNGSALEASNAITVAGGGALVIGQDSLGGLKGGLVIGNNADDPLQDGYNGIFCLSGAGLGCSVSDVSLKGASLLIEAQEGYDLWADDDAVISLTSSPSFGLAPSSSGFHQCSDKLEAISAGQAAIVLNGSAQVMLGNGSITCVAGDGIDLQASASGGLPSLDMDSTTIQGTQVAVHAYAGTATVSNSTVWYNYNGVWQDTDGTNIGKVDLSGGAAGGTNTVVCSDGAENAFRKGGAGAPGVSVLNTTSNVLLAAGVDWDTPAPDLFSCDATLTDCTCQRSSCVVDAGGQGMDAVYVGTGTIDTSDGGSSSADCDVNPPKQGCGPGNPCPPGQTCCLPLPGSTGPSVCGQVCLG